MSPTSTPAKKTKRLRWSWRKPVDKPKRPLSAYNLFFADVRRKLLNERCRRGSSPKGLGFGNLARTVAAQWKVIDPVRKSDYQRRSRQEHDRYEVEVARWKVKQDQEGSSDASTHPKRSRRRTVGAAALLKGAPKKIDTATALEIACSMPLPHLHESDERRTQPEQHIIPAHFIHPLSPVASSHSTEWVTPPSAKIKHCKTPPPQDNINALLGQCTLRNVTMSPSSEQSEDESRVNDKAATSVNEAIMMQVERERSDAAGRLFFPAMRRHEVFASPRNDRKEPPPFMPDLDDDQTEDEDGPIVPLVTPSNSSRDDDMRIEEANAKSPVIMRATTTPASRGARTPSPIPLHNEIFRRNEPRGSPVSFLLSVLDEDDRKTLLESFPPPSQVAEV